ncbi:hypothetical protein A2110_01335 [Candidatus Jorgensenbacteria bacterium GWA1_54_12]|uniref:DUF8128 domain-containing protein n=1 Tax=Candidatus Jorgensenbacteria bacterium GWA1_54_12 TaxID=1798468 RepID=A0A1F6BK63_9BACT|nr:MAG: hypothetical protein A2110_01335 [Candidatus Jorgensenbacteria bacterium GWA1_54_12]
MDISVFVEQVQAFLRAAMNAWWLVVPSFLVIVLVNVWVWYREEKFRKSVTWVMLEMVPAREVAQTPKAMEQVFAVMHGMWSGGLSFADKWWKGVVERWASFEIVGRAGSVHFYVRVPEVYRDMVEAAVYAHYPETEIRLIQPEDDYVRGFPADLPSDEYDVWGSEFVLGKEAPYPIRTYPSFESIVEEQRVDPIAGITEVMSRLENTEAIWLQFIIRGTGNDWTKKTRDVIDEIRGKKKPEEKKLGAQAGALFDSGFTFLQNLAKAPLTLPTWDEKKEEKKEERPLEGYRHLVEAVEHKVEKLGFETTIRFLYVDRKDAFTPSNAAAVLGTFRQFNTWALNYVRPNIKAMTIAKQPFKKKKILIKKRRLYRNYRVREMTIPVSVFNIEELATMYHFPMTGVKSPTLRRVETRRGSPPPDLPIV